MLNKIKDKNKTERYFKPIGNLTFIENINKFGLIGAIGDYIAVSIRFFIIYRFPKYAEYIIKDRKGKCKQCGECCGYCEYLKENICVIHTTRKEKGKVACILAPFPLDIKINPRFKDCGFYYKNCLKRTKGKKVNTIFPTKKY